MLGTRCWDEVVGMQVHCWGIDVGIHLLNEDPCQVGRSLPMPCCDVLQECAHSSRHSNACDEIEHASFPTSRHVTAGIHMGKQVYTVTQSTNLGTLPRAIASSASPVPVRGSPGPWVQAEHPTSRSDVDPTEAMQWVHVHIGSMTCWMTDAGKHIRLQHILWRYQLDVSQRKASVTGTKDALHCLERLCSILHRNAMVYVTRCNAVDFVFATLTCYATSTRCRSMHIG